MTIAYPMRARDEDLTTAVHHAAELWAIYDSAYGIEAREVESIALLFPDLSLLAFIQLAIGKRSWRIEDNTLYVEESKR